MPLAVALLIVIAVLSSVLAFLARHWLPLLASANGIAIDRQLHSSLVWMGAAFLFTQFVLAAFVWRFRQQRGAVSPAPRSNALFEVMAVIVTGSAFLWLGATGGTFSGEERLAESASPVRVEVTGTQFQWYFRYPGPDGKLGATKPELVDASIGNALGIDRSDPASRDDLVLSQLVLPAGREVDLELHAQDVVHSFYIPAMRAQMNAVPGMTTRLRFTPARPGTYEAVCSQLCGLGHYRMKAVVRIFSPADFEMWQRQAFAMAEQRSP